MLRNDRHPAAPSAVDLGGLPVIPLKPSIQADCPNDERLQLPSSAWWLFSASACSWKFGLHAKAHRQAYPDRGGVGYRKKPQLPYRLGKLGPILTSIHESEFRP